jgi:hypothetical protein
MKPQENPGSKTYLLLRIVTNLSAMSFSDVTQLTMLPAPAASSTAHASTPTAPDACGWCFR